MTPRLCFRAVVLVVEVERAGITIEAHKDSRGEAPANIEAITGRSMRRRLEMGDHNVRLGHLKNRPRTQRRHAFRACVLLVVWVTVEQLLLDRFREMRYLRPRTRRNPGIAFQYFHVIPLDCRSAGTSV